MDLNQDGSAGGQVFEEETLSSTSYPFLQPPFSTSKSPIIQLLKGSHSILKRNSSRSNGHLEDGMESQEESLNENSWTSVLTFMGVIRWKESPIATDLVISLNVPEGGPLEVGNGGRELIKSFLSTLTVSDWNLFNGE